MRQLRFSQFLIFFSFCIVGLKGHGRLMEPPARNVMWRFGFSNPTNYNDNEVFCGGYGVQYLKNDGKCGVCGDNWADPAPREHEGGGKFGNGLIARRYAMGQEMEVEVELTTNHWGYFEFKLCPVNAKKQVATQECMDQHILTAAKDETSTKFYIPEGTQKSANLTYLVKLPEGLTCQQCVLQWTYRTGNTWGICPNGTETIGCGDQEVFRNCADIQIFSNTLGFPPNAIDQPSAIYFRDASTATGRRPLVIRHQICIPTEEFEDDPDMGKWCQENCMSYPPMCPMDKCRCIVDCVATGRLAGVEGTDVFCHRNCIRYPHHESCPKDLCHCSTVPHVANVDVMVDEEHHSEVVAVDSSHQFPVISVDDDSSDWQTIPPKEQVDGTAESVTDEHAEVSVVSGQQTGDGGNPALPQVIAVADDPASWETSEVVSPIQVDPHSAEANVEDEERVIVVRRPEYVPFVPYVYGNYHNEDLPYLKRE